MSERADAVRRLILKKHERGITYDRIIKWLEGLKYEFDCEWNEFIDTSIKQVKGGVYGDITRTLHDQGTKSDDRVAQTGDEVDICQLGLFTSDGA